MGSVKQTATHIAPGDMLFVTHVNLIRESFLRKKDTPPAFPILPSIKIQEELFSLSLHALAHIEVATI